MNRVLVLSHPESDYGGAFLFNGFCRVLGPENVFDYPVNPAYHGRDNKNYIRPWHHNEPGTTDRLKWFQEGYPEKPLDREAVSGLLRDGFFDLVVLESWRWTVQQSWRELESAIRASGAKVILHDGEDFASFALDALETVKPDYYLKRELLKGVDTSGLPCKVLPFPFSAPDQIVEWADAQPPATIERDIACLLGISWEPRRTLALELRAGIEAGEFTGYVATSDPPTESLQTLKEHPLLPFWEYLEVLRTSRFGVSMRGWGIDTVRHWEIAVLTGLLADELDIQIPYRFTDNGNYLSYGRIVSCRQNATAIAKNNGVEGVREMGILHARTFHTNSARVKWLLEQITD